MSFDSLQGGRGLAAVAVLLYHANAILSLPKYFGREVFPYLDYTGVHYFFVVSGFVMVLAHARDVGRKDRVGLFFWKRLKRIYPLLWCALAVVAAAFFLVPALGGGEGRDPWTLISAFLALPAKREYLLAAEWTLRHEILFYLLVGLVIWKPRTGVVVAAVWTVACAVAEGLDLPYPWSFFLSGFHSLFAFGALAAVAYLRGFRHCPLAMLAAGLVIYLGTPVAIWAFDLKQTELTHLAFGLGAALCILGGVNAEQTGVLRWPRALVFLGEASYAIYLAHFPALTAAARLIAPLERRLPDAALFTLVSASALAVGVVFHLVVEKPIIAFMRARSARAPQALSRQSA